MAAILLEDALNEKLEAVPVRWSVAWFAVQMEKKLRLNEQKGGWSDCTYDYLMKRILDEHGELRRKLKALHNDEILAELKVIGEAADIANFAMMIADNAKDSQ